MRSSTLLVGVVLVVGACSTRSLGYPGSPSGDVVVVGEESGREGRGAARSPGRVPPGHYPPPGECRIWYVGRPPGQQPPPARCESLVGRVPRGAFLLYNGRAWDTEHDWRRDEARSRGSVPAVVLRIMSSLTR